eukprot:scaffold180060_cov31-Tisochrysis_lutea.AAC.1
MNRRRRRGIGQRNFGVGSRGGVRKLGWQIETAESMDEGIGDGRKGPGSTAQSRGRRGWDHGPGPSCISLAGSQVAFRQIWDITQLSHRMSIVITKIFTYSHPNTTKLLFSYPRWTDIDIFFFTRRTLSELSKRAPRSTFFRDL